MYERAQRLGCNKSDCEISLKRLSVGKKKTSKYSMACMIKRATCQSKLYASKLSIIYMDESSFEANTIRHRYTPRGKRYINCYN